MPSAPKQTPLRHAPRTLAATLAIAAILLHSGCTKRETDVEKGNREGILYLGNGAEPKGLDPHVVTGVAEHNILAALFEGLVAEDPGDLHPIPGAAERWDISPDGKTYTFHIRKDAVWSNGDPVTAEDFVFSYRRMLSPGLAAEYAYMLYPLKNAAPFNRGEIGDFAQVGARATDPATLVLELETPVPYFLELLNHYSWWPVHPATILKHGEFDNPDNPWTRPENFVGNGAFTLATWDINRRIVVRKNPRYRGAAGVSLNEIHFLPIDSADTEERAFRDGKIHITQTVPLHRIDYYRKNAPKLIRFDPYLGTYFYRFNVERPPFNDRRVRQALALAVNRGQITEYVLKGGQQPAFTFTPPGTGGYTAPDGFAEDVERARKLLADAGYPNGEGFPSVELLYNTSEAHRTLAEAIQQMWKTELNIDVQLSNQEWKVYLDSMKQQNYTIARSAWIGDYNDPNTFLDMWVTDGGNNRTGWSNPEYDRLVAEAAATSDGAKRFDLFRQAEAILMEDMPIVPVYFYVRSMLIRPEVRGWEPTLLDHHPYTQVRLEPGTP